MRFKEFLKETKEKHAVMAFMRANPITSGHELVVNKVKDIANKVGGTAHIILSHSHDSKKNPLTPEQKLKHAKRAFSDVLVSTSDKSAPNFLAQAAKLYQNGVTNLHMVGGQDRVEDFKNLLHKYNDVKGPHGHYDFKDIKVHSAGDRDPDSEGIGGISGSKMREYASKGNYKEFRKGVPSKMTDAQAKEMYDDLRKEMKINENINYQFQKLFFEITRSESDFKAIFLVGGLCSGKDYILNNTLSKLGLTEISFDKTLEYLSNRKINESEKSKSTTEIQQRLALFKRNGLIINGSCDEIEKIITIKERLENLGYESQLLMVNITDEVSKQRNIERGYRGARILSESIRKEKWNSSQSAKHKLVELFGSNYKEFDNSEDLRYSSKYIIESKEQEMNSLFEQFQEFIREPSKSKKLNENYSLSDSSSLNLLLLGNSVDEINLSVIEEEPDIKLLRDDNGIIKTFMLRFAAEKEAKKRDGKVINYKNGYVVKMKDKDINENFSNEFNTLITESIDKNIEPGLSMAASGESLARDTGEKIKKERGKASQVAETIGDGGEMATSMSDQKEDELRRKGISIKTFRARRPIG